MSKPAYTNRSTRVKPYKQILHFRISLQDSTGNEMAPAKAEQTLKKAREVLAKQLGAATLRHCRLLVTSDKIRLETAPLN